MCHAYMVDFENVARKGLIGIGLLNSDDLVYIFYSNSKSNINSGLRENMLSCKARIVHQKVTTKTPNALDFQLSTEIGRLVEKGTISRISIISEDRGYEAVVDYVRKVTPSVIIDQQPFIMAAKQMEEEGITTAEILRRQKPQKLGMTFMELDRSKQFEKEIRKLVPDVEDEEIKMLKGICMGTTSRREKYIKALKTFGKEHGLVLYRGETRGKLAEKYLQGVA